MGFPPPAALKQGFAGGVEIKGGGVCGQKRLNPHVWGTGVDARPLAELVAEHVADGIFDFERGKGQIGQRAADGIDFDLDGVFENA